MAVGALRALKGASGADRAREVTIKLLGDVGDFTKQFGLAGDVAQEVLEEVTKLEEKIERISIKVGHGLLGVAAASQGMLTWATMTASGWETAFRTVEKTVDATAQELSGLERDVRQMSLEIPMPAESLAQLASLAGQLGVTTEAIDEYTKAAAQLGEATDLSAEGAIFQLSQFTNITGTAEDKIQNLSSALVELGNNTASTESRVLDFGLRIAGVGNVVGLTASQILGIGAAFASAGVESERGGTAVSKVLLKINEAATVGGQSLRIFTNVLGMTTDQFREMVKTDPGEVFARFLEALKEAGDQAVPILHKLELSDQRLVQSFTSVANSAQDMRKTMGMSNEAFAEGTALGEEAGRAFSTLASEIQKMRNNFREVRRSIGRHLLAPVKLVVQGIAEMIEIFNKLPQGIKSTVGWFLTLTTGLIGTTGAVLSLIKVWNALWAAFVSTRLAKTIYGFLTQFELFNTVLAATGNGIRGVMSALWSFTKAGIKNRVLGLLGAMKRGFLGLLASIKSVTVALLTNPWTYVFAAAAAAIYGLVRAFRSTQSEIDALSASSDTLAESMGYQTAKVEELGQALTGLEAATKSTGDQFAIANQQLLEFLGTFEGADLDAMIRATALQVFSDVAAAEGVDKGIQAMEETLDRLNEQFGTDVFISDVNDAADAVASFADSFSALVSSSENEGFWNSLPWNRGMGPGEEGKIQDFAETAAQNFLSSFDKSLSTAEGAEFMQRFFVDLFEAGRLGEDLGGEAKEELHSYYRTLADEISKHPELGDFSLTDFRKKLMDPLTRDMTALDQEFFRQLIEGNKGLKTSFADFFNSLDIGFISAEASTQKFVDAYVRASEKVKSEGFIVPEVSDKDLAGLEETTRLMQFFGEEIDQFSDEAARSSFIQTKFDEMEARFGLEESIQILDEYINSLSVVERHQDDIARKAIKHRQQLQKELDRMMMDEFKGQVESMPLAEALDAIDQKLKDLRTEGKLTADVMRDLMNLREQKLNQEIQRLMQLVEAEEQLNKRRDELAEDHKDRLDDLAKEERKAVREHAENIAQVIRMDQRMYSEYALGLERIIMRSQEQNVLLEEWASNLRRLRQMGLSGDVIGAMGMDDPQNFSQVDRVLEEAVANPDLIDQINRQWQERLDIMGGVAEETTAVDDIHDRFDERRDELIEGYQESLAQIDEQISELGKDAGMSFAEAVEAGKNSASPHIRELANMLSEFVPDAAEEGAEKVMESQDKVDKNWGHVVEGLEDGTNRATGHMDTAFKNVVDNVKAYFTGEQGLVATVSGSFDDLVTLGAGLAEQYQGFAYQDGTFQATFPSLSGNLPDNPDVVDFVNELGKLVGPHGQITEQIRNASPRTVQEAVKMARQLGAKEAWITEALEKARMALGGLVTGPTNALIGESGPEAVIPLNARGVSFVADAMKQAMPRSFDGGGELVGAIHSLVSTMQAGGGMRKETNQFGPITVNADADVDKVEAKLKAKARQRRLVGAREKTFSDG